MQVLLAKKIKHSWCVCVSVCLSLQHLSMNKGLPSDSLEQWKWNMVTHMGVFQGQFAWTQELLDDEDDLVMPPMDPSERQVCGTGLWSGWNETRLQWI